jgi:hypothetical protein
MAVRMERIFFEKYSIFALENIFTRKKSMHEKGRGKSWVKKVNGSGACVM